MTENLKKNLFSDQNTYLILKVLTVGKSIILILYVVSVDL